MAKKKSLAKTNPRYMYRTVKEEKENVEGRIKDLVEKINQGDYYHIDQNTVFLEAIYRGLDYLERAELTPDHDEGYYQIEFIELNRKCSECKTVSVAPFKNIYKCEECGESYDSEEFSKLKTSRKK